MYEDGLCACGHPRERAWHADTDGFWEHDEQLDAFVCLACTARNDGEQVVYHRVRDTMPSDRPLSPLVFGETTLPPTSGGGAQNNNGDEAIGG